MCFFPKWREHMTSIINSQYTNQVSLTPISLESRTVRCDAIKTALLESQSLWMQTQALQGDTLLWHQLQITNMTTEQKIVFAPKPRRTRQESTLPSHTPHIWRRWYGSETTDIAPASSETGCQTIRYAPVEFFLMFIGLRKRTLQPLLKKGRLGFVYITKTKGIL
jgi:hypothetical protein